MARMPEKGCVHATETIDGLLEFLSLVVSVVSLVRVSVGRTDGPGGALVLRAESSLKLLHGKSRYWKFYKSSGRLVHPKEQFRPGLEELLASCQLLCYHAGGCYHGESAVVEFLSLQLFQLLRVCRLET